MRDGRRGPGWDIHEVHHSDGIGEGIHPGDDDVAGLECGSGGSAGEEAEEAEESFHKAIGFLIILHI